jgi:vacuolar-type H+-ATPase subunit H
MPRARDFLDRFRPVAAPGAATELGVPADRVAEASAELAAVFGAFVEVEAEVQRIRREADQQATARVAAATATAEAVVADGRRRAEEERLAVAAEAARRSEREAAEALAAAERDAAAVTAGASARMPDLLVRVRGVLRDMVGGPSP